MNVMTNIMSLIVMPCLLIVPGQPSLTNSRDVSTMDTLPLSDNFNTSYSRREDEYEDPALSCPTACLDDAALEKKIISELVHNNLRPRRLNQTSSKTQPRDPAPQDTGVSGDGGVGNEVEVTVADADTPALPASASQTLELLLLHPNDRDALDTPLLPQRTHSLLYCAQKASQRAVRPQKDSRESEGEEEEEEERREEDDAPSPNHRDSLYTSMPDLRDSPSSSAPESPDLGSGRDDGSPAQSELEEHCYKSLPDLGDGTRALSYYQISRGGTSEGCGEPASDGQMQLITSL